jgi:hypothetical protein
MTTARDPRITRVTTPRGDAPRRYVRAFGDTGRPSCHTRAVVLRDRIVDLSGLVFAIASGDRTSIAPGPTGHRVFEDALPDGSVEPVERD